MKGGVILGAGGLARTISFKEEVSSRKFKSLWIDPMSYSESILLKDWFSSIEKTFPSAPKKKHKKQN